MVDAAILAPVVRNLNDRTDRERPRSKHPTAASEIRNVDTTLVAARASPSLRETHAAGSRASEPQPPAGDEASSAEASASAPSLVGEALPAR
jgi:hypothetical protein